MEIVSSLQANLTLPELDLGHASHVATDMELDIESDSEQFTIIKPST